MSVGIYKITNPNGKIYIGQSTDIKKRFKYYYRLECKGQTKIFNSLKKYGPENHVFEIIEECSIEQLNEREIYWMGYYNVLKEGLNLKEGGKGGKHIQSTKDKISLKLKGKKISEETKLKIYTQERSKNISNKTKGLKRSEEVKLKISLSKKGKSIGVGRKQSQEERKKRSDIRKGYKPSKDHIENMRKSMIGKNTKNIICININKIYTSIKEASKDLNVSERSISNILLGFSKQTKNKLTFKYI